MADESFEYFLTKFPLAAKGPECTQMHLDIYRDLLPPALISYWQEFGFSGFGNGIVWLVDPLEWEPTISEAFQSAPLGPLRHPSLPEDTQYIPIARGAFGKIWFWTPGYGKSVTIEPADGTVFYSPLESKRPNSNLNTAIQVVFSGRSSDRFNYRDKNEEFIFGRVFERLGLLSFDQVYGFSPAVRAGGVADAANAAILPIHAHMAELAGATIASGGWDTYVA
ncbi:GAD-like domain-containing protein [Mycobacteroides abscessus]|uniref:GAD-like domain-containing protein n=1 Tax=Mycobacteroides abscessus TaxID=36809 RepID=UPI000C25CBCD|nr:GAD-like domain-containing protein [Mycobacteroides abscessus]